eukprot:1920700-Prymnesium_polylepis.1
MFRCCPVGSEGTPSSRRIAGLLDGHSPYSLGTRQSHCLSTAGCEHTQHVSSWQSGRTQTARLQAARVRDSVSPGHAVVDR